MERRAPTRNPLALDARLAARRLRKAADRAVAAGTPALRRPERALELPRLARGARGDATRACRGRMEVRTAAVRADRGVRVGRGSARAARVASLRGSGGLARRLPRGARRARARTRLPGRGRRARDRARRSRGRRRARDASVARAGRTTRGSPSGRRAGRPGPAGGRGSRRARARAIGRSSGSRGVGAERESGRPALPPARPRALGRAPRRHARARALSAGARRRHAARRARPRRPPDRRGARRGRALPRPDRRDVAASPRAVLHALRHGHVSPRPAPAAGARALLCGRARRAGPRLERGEPATRARIGDRRERGAPGRSRPARAADLALAAKLGREPAALRWPWRSVRATAGRESSALRVDVELLPERAS